MNKLGFGFMRLPLVDPNDQKAIDLPQVEAMVDAFLKAGCTYCDTAWMYHSFMSEGVVGKALVARHPRDRFTIASKMPVAMLHSHEEGVDIFARQKKKLGVDFFDYYLVHDMGGINYEKAKKYDMLSFLREKRAQGEIRRLGFSCHDNAEFLDRVLTECPWFEFVQLQINYLDWESDGVQSRKCYEVCVKHDKPVIVMEPIKGGNLAKLPAPAERMLRDLHPDWTPASWALRFAASLPQVKVVLSGMSNLEQLKQNAELMRDMEPLNDAEKDVLARAATLIRDTIAIPCTGCHYCVEENECPMGIPIPEYFSLYNTQAVYANKDWTPEQGVYRNIVTRGGGRASDCVACRQCERVCPQHIEISSFMPEVAKALE